MSNASKSAWTLPASLKRVQLQNLARLIGAPVTGTKPELLTNIHDILSPTRQHLQAQNGKKPSLTTSKPLRVLSIDMGIRNLAYAFLTQEHNSGHKNASELSFGKPVLHQWQRTDLTHIKAIGLQDAHDKATAPKADPEEASVPDDSFEPNSLARHAYTFAKYCASLDPTHILIERQRFRSGGHSAVQEWSLRVGMLEGMLYATFQTLIAEKLLTNTAIEPMLPMRVNKYWFADQDVPATGKQAKLAKIAIVSDMLKAVHSEDLSFSVHGDISGVVDGFGTKTIARGSSTKKTTSSSPKLDDMSDALLQGLAWLKWQENRVRLLTFGPESLGIDD